MFEDTLNIETASRLVAKSIDDARQSVMVLYDSFKLGMDESISRLDAIKKIVSPALSTIAFDLIICKY